MDVPSSDLKTFALWFQNNHGFIDASAMDITIFPGHGGRGAIALKDIPVSRIVISAYQ